MTRKFLDDLSAEISLKVPDNTTGLVTPAIVRNLMIDITDSTVEDIAFIYRSSPLLAYARGVAPALLGGVFNATYLAPNMDGTSVDENAGTIILGNVAGRQYRGVLQITFEGTNGAEVLGGLYIDGVLSSLWAGGVTIPGVGKQVTLNIPWYIQKSVAASIIGPAIWLPNGAGTIDILAAQFSCSILPTNNP